MDNMYFSQLFVIPHRFADPNDCLYPRRFLLQILAKPKLLWYNLCQLEEKFYITYCNNEYKYLLVNEKQ